jgi:diguanylate cyclase (GGDEF)-like protein
MSLTPYCTLLQPCSINRAFRQAAWIAVIIVLGKPDECPKLPFVHGNRGAFSGGKETMHQQRKSGLLRWSRGLLLALAMGVAGLVPDAAASAQAAAAGPPDRAGQFDGLYQRIYTGDLSTLDEHVERTYVERLKTLLPANDAHRRRLLDTLRCDIDFDSSPKEGLAFANARLAEAQQANDTDAVIRFYFCRGGYQEIVANTHDSLADYQRAIDLARKSGSDVLLAWGLMSRGGSESLLGIYGKALADLLEARRMFIELHLPLAADQTLQELGVAYRRLGYIDKARAFLKESVSRDRRSDHQATLAISMVQLGFADQDAGDFSNALDLLRQALTLSGNKGDQQMRGSTRLAIAGVLNDMGRHVEALASLTQARADFVATDDSSDMGMLAFEDGRAYAGTRQRDRALAAFDLAGSAFDKLGNRRYQETLYKARAQLLEAMGEPARALIDYKKFLAAHEDVERQRADQQAQMLREQFDTARSNLENARLKSEQVLKDRELETLIRARHWQRTATLLLAVLLALLALLAIRQLGKLQWWKSMASLDSLTGVSNRRGLEHFLDAAMQRARATRKPLSVLAVDIDRFKLINDAHGHAAGDRTLVRIAHACRALLREGDLIARIGGEEFLVVLPDSGLAEAAEIAERLRVCVEDLPAADAPRNGCAATISVGLAEMTAADMGLEDLQKRADEALYRAKAEGRNRIVGSPPAPSPAAEPKRATYRQASP